MCTDAEALTPVPVLLGRQAVGEVLPQELSR